MMLQMIDTAVDNRLLDLSKTTLSVTVRVLISRGV